MADERNRVLVIGLDGVTFDLLKPWVDAGELPTFKQLMQHGVSGSLLSTTPPLSPLAWMSFATGKNPGKHGIFDFTKRAPDSYDITIVNSEDVEGDTLWEIISKSGRKVGVINVTVTYPPREVDGFLVSGMLTPSLESNFAFPEDLRMELKKIVGTYRFDVEEEFGDGREDIFLKDLYRVTEVREKATLHLMKKFDWDFFMVMFYGTELVQNKFWSYMDPTHPNHDLEKFEKYGDTILRFFQRIDLALSKILQHIDEKTTVIIMSDHGHGPLHKVLYVNRWLMELGLLSFKGNILVQVKKWLCRHNLPIRIYHVLEKLGLGRLRTTVSLRRQIDIVNAFLSFRDVDWSKTKAYSHGHIGRIFLNLKGREPNGIVEPGEEYNEVRNLIIRELHELSDPETGEKVVDQVFTNEEIYAGPEVAEAPDIVFLMKDMTYIAEYGSFGFHSDSLFGQPILMDSGAHKPEGILIVNGENVNRGKTLSDSRILDVAPTILYMMGIPVPSDMDGQVLTGIFSEDYLNAHPVEYAEEVLPARKAKPLAYSEKEKEQIKERLKRLGYLG
jgi:predicted AlkP superfamily phosphohydrolase/phosphomutase